MLSESLLEHLQQRFTDFFSSPTVIHHYQAVYGGDMNKCFMLRTDKGDFFIKVNASLFGLDMFEKEARGLLQLANARSIKVPMPLFDGKFHQQIFLVIEYIESGQPSDNFWERFGESIAQLHSCSSEQFGLDYNNYIGKLTQSNQQHSLWIDFYATERILPLIKKAYENGLLHKEHVSDAERICDKFNDIFSDEPPALVHGDLWKGNFVTGTNGQAAIFDPAVYYGNREMDIAMSLLFGGFDEKFYNAYNYYYPLKSGWQNRVPLCQLYPLLVHLLLFGGDYRANVIEILEKYK